MALKKSNPGCSCCGSGDCEYCTSINDPVKVVISGVTGTGCTGINGTHFVPRNLAAGYCSWETSVTGGNIQAEVVPAGTGLARWRVFGPGILNAVRWIGSAQSEPFDCTAEETLSHDQSFGTCDGSSSSCVVNAP